MKKGNVKGTGKQYKCSECGNNFNIIIGNTKKYAYQMYGKFFCSYKCNRKHFR